MLLCCAFLKSQRALLLLLLLWLLVIVCNLAEDQTKNQSGNQLSSSTSARGIPQGRMRRRMCSCVVLTLSLSFAHSDSLCLCLCAQFVVLFWWLSFAAFIYLPFCWPVYYPSAASSSFEVQATIHFILCYFCSLSLSSSLLFQHHELYNFH